MKVTKFNRNKYMLWFEQTITPEQTKEIEKKIKKLGIKAEIISGVKAPTLIECQ